MEDYYDDTMTKSNMFCQKCNGFMVEDFSGDGEIWSYCEDCNWSPDYEDDL